MSVFSFAGHAFRMHDVAARTGQRKKNKQTSFRCNFKNAIRAEFSDDMDSFESKNDALMGSWDGNCLHSDVENPLAETFDGDCSTTAHMQSAITGSDPYRSVVPIMCWTHLLDRCLTEERLGVILGHEHHDESNVESSNTTENRVNVNVPTMEADAAGSIWKTLLQDAESQPPSTKALNGILLYGLGDIIAQARFHM